MTFFYQTEYRLGRRVRVGRKYAGLRALVAILLDLAAGVTFGIAGLAIGLARLVVRVTCRVVFALLALPFRVARAIVEACRAPAAAKPAWAGAEEL